MNTSPSDTNTVSPHHSSKESSHQDAARLAPRLGFLALLMALFSFYWAGRYPDYPWDGPILMGVAGVLLLAALHLTARVKGKDTLPTNAPATNLPATDVPVTNASSTNLPATDVPPTNASSTDLPATNVPARNAPVTNAPTDSLPSEPFSMGEIWQRLPLDQVAPWRFVGFAISILLTLALLFRLIPLDRPSYQLDVFFWLAAIGSFALSVAPPVSRPREDWGLWWEVNRNTVLVLVVIVGGAAGLRLWDLGNIPAVLGGDEGSQGLEALRVLSGEIRNPFTTGWLSVPTMSFFFNSITIDLWGRTMTALRFPWAIVGTSTILITFWLVTRLRGLTLGLMTAALLATYHYHIHFSRLGSNQIADPFFISLSLLFLYRARDRNSPLDWLMVGVVMGVAQYFYAGARLTVVVVMLCFGFFCWLDRSRWSALRNTLGGGLTFGGAFLITAAPMIQYALRFPDDYNARVNEVGIIQSGWLEREVINRGVSIWVPLWEQFERAFLAFNVFPDRTVWYGSPLPLMHDIWAVLFMIGLLYVTLRLFTPSSEPRYFPFVAWWWSGMFLGGMLTESPPSAQRLIVLAPPAVFFIAVLLLEMAQFIQDFLGRESKRYVFAGLAIVVLGFGYQSITWYFLEFTPLTLYGSRNGEIATEMGKLLATDLEPDETVVFFGPPHMYLGFGSIPYLAPAATEGIDMPEELLTAPPTDESLGLPAGQRPFFIAHPRRAEELKWVEEAYPDGRRYQIEDSRGNLLFWVYEPGSK